jgi:hypothetical protein
MSFQRHAFDPGLGFIKTFEPGAPAGVDVLDVKDLTPVIGIAIKQPVTNQK